MRIFHLSDLHIGKLFFNVHLTPDQIYLLDQAADLAAEQKVDVVVISGDVYDRSVPPVEGTEALDRFLSRLILDLAIPVILIPGNHDSAERLSFGSRMLRDRGLHIAADTTCIPIVLQDATGPVTFIPVPFIEPITFRRTLLDADIPDFTAAYRHFLSGISAEGRTVCIAHCYTAGCDECESERPLAIGGTYHVDSDVFSPFTLTLLGHLHRPQRVGKNAWYAGSPLRYSFSELDHHKVFSIFDIDGDGTVARHTFPVEPLRELRQFRGNIDDIMRAAESDLCRDDYLSVTLTDRGALFDYAARIRAIYPNILSIIREHREGEGDTVRPGELRRLTDREIVGRFFAHVAGEMDETEDSVLTGILDELNRRDGGEPCAP